MMILGQLTMQLLPLLQFEHNFKPKMANLILLTKQLLLLIQKKLTHCNFLQNKHFDHNRQLEIHLMLQMGLHLNGYYYPILGFHP
jgi:hypothetical protein